MLLIEVKKEIDYLQFSNSPRQLSLILLLLLLSFFFFLLNIVWIIIFYGYVYANDRN